MFGFIRSVSFTSQVMIPVIGLILFGIALLLPGDFGNSAVYGNNLFYLPEDGWLYPLWEGMSALPLWAQIIPAWLITVLTASLLVSTDLKNLLIGSRSYAMAYVFLFLVASAGHFFLFHPAMLAGLFMVLSLRFLLDLYKAENAYSIVFAVGFSWGIAILLYPPVCFLIPAILFGLLVMVTTGWRHWLVSLLGIAVPFLLTGFFWFLIGEFNYQVASFSDWFRLRQTFVPGFITREPLLAAWAGLIVVWAIIASINYRNPKIQSRQLFQANFLLFVSILLVTIFLETVSIEIIWLLVIPVSFLMTFWALKVERAWMREIFFFSLLLFYIWFRISELI